MPWFLMAVIIIILEVPITIVEVPINILYRDTGDDDHNTGGKVVIPVAMIVTVNVTTAILEVTVIIPVVMMAILNLCLNPVEFKTNKIARLCDNENLVIGVCLYIRDFSFIVAHRENPPLCVL